MRPPLAYSLKQTLVLLLLISPSSAYEDMYFLYERSAYLENLIMPGAWWANPAAVAEIDRYMVQTVNVSPLGDRYTISSIRFFMPLTSRITAGVGILGVGEDQTGFLSATGESVQYTSRFVFSRPSVQAGVGAALPFFGSVGALVSVGTERRSVGIYETRNFATVGVGIGWMSPRIAHVVTFSTSFLLVGHFQQEPYWDRDAKLGIRITLPEDLLVMAVEYTFPLRGGFRFRTPRKPWTYEVIKGLLSLRVYRSLGLLLGFSSDFHSARELSYYPDYNGDCIHGGLEVRRSGVYPFFGGYEVGVSTDRRWNVIHRLWLGYFFGKKNADHD